MLKKIILVIVMLLMVSITVGCMDMKAKLEELKNLPLTDVDLTLVGDGLYEGTYKAGLVSVKVRVRVENHRISEIELLEHDNGKGKPGEAVIESIIEKQSVKVDAISGATFSSIVICKAVESALASALQ